LMLLKKTANPNPLEIFDAALKNASPVMEVRSRRIGGANYQVPVEVRPERRNQLGMRWILAGVRKQKGGKTHQVLAEELIAASNNEGQAVKKKKIHTEWQMPTKRLHTLLGRNYFLYNDKKPHSRFFCLPTTFIATPHPKCYNKNTI